LAKDEKDKFEKESMDADFIIVKPCDKKPNKVVHQSKQTIQNKLKKHTSDSSSATEEKIFLSEIIGLKAIKSHNVDKIST
jgi:hypothetical protein